MVCFLTTASTSCWANLSQNRLCGIFLFTAVFLFVFFEIVVVAWCKFCKRKIRDVTDIIVPHCGGGGGSDSERERERVHRPPVADHEQKDAVPIIRHPVAQPVDVHDVHEHHDIVADDQAHPVNERRRFQQVRTYCRVQMVWHVANRFLHVTKLMDDVYQCMNTFCQKHKPTVNVRFVDERPTIVQE
jgi:hypothetical protein